MKFGGGCLKSRDKFSLVGKIVAAQQEKTMVVVSAVNGVTDILVQGIKSACSSEKNVRGVIADIVSIHRNIIDNVIKQPDLRRRIRVDVASRIGKLERLLYGISYTREISDSVEAAVLSFGERICAAVFASVIEDIGREAAAVEADEIGLLTDDSHKSATADLEAASKNLKRFLNPMLENGVIPVITGYFGCTRDGKVATFGRNGSDYSAAVIAYGMEAANLEIWKDVDGFMSADPCIVPDAVKLSRLSYYEAAELSYFGARILHPRTVEPLLKGDFKVSFKSLCTPENEGTELVPEDFEVQDVIKSVTCNKRISVLRILGPGVGFKPGIIADIGRKMGNAEINIYSIFTSQTCINLLIDREDSKNAYESLHRLAGGVIEKVLCEDDISLIAVVGSGIQKRRGIAARVFSAVAQAGVNVEMISSGASESAYYFIVKESDTEAAIRSVHAEFFSAH